MNISLQKAEEIAVQGLKEKIARSKRLHQYQFEAARLHTEYDRCFVFAAPSEEMGEAGYAPAALFVYVDKQDGHLWNAAEQDDYFYAHEQQAQKQPIAA